MVNGARSEAIFLLLIGVHDCGKADFAYCHGDGFPRNWQQDQSRKQPTHIWRCSPGDNALIKALKIEEVLRQCHLIQEAKLENSPHALYSGKGISDDIQ